MASNRKMIKLDNIIKHLNQNEIKKLDLADVKCAYFRARNTASSTDDVLIKLAKAMTDNHSLEEFGFYSIDFLKAPPWKVKGVKALTNALMKHPSLNSYCLDLTQPYLSPEIKAAFLEVMKNPAIEYVYIKLAPNDNETIKEMAEAIKDNPTLKQIKIIGSDFATRDKAVAYSPEVWEAMATGFANKSLTHLMIDEMYLEHNNFSTFAQALAKMRTLKILSFSGCNLTEKEMPELNSVLKNNPELAHLDLQYNSINQEGLHTILPSIERSKDLHHLNLRHTGLNEQAMEELVAVLNKKNSPVNSLYISNNLFGKISIPAVKRLLTENNNIRRLAAVSVMTSEDVLELKTALMTTKIREIFFKHEDQLPLSDEVSAALLEIGKTNKSLRVLDVIGQTKVLNAVLEQNANEAHQSCQNFVSSTIVMAQGFFNASAAPSAHQPLRMLPLEVFMAVLAECGKEAIGMSDKDVAACSGLIVDNLHMRANLLSETSEDAVKKVKSSDWWHKANSKGEQIFVAESVQEEAEEIKSNCKIM